jgi:hypothetical protein
MNTSPLPPPPISAGYVYCGIKNSFLDFSSRVTYVKTTANFNVFICILRTSERLYRPTLLAFKNAVLEKWV